MLMLMLIQRLIVCIVAYWRRLLLYFSYYGRGPTKRTNQPLHYSNATSCAYRCEWMVARTTSKEKGPISVQLRREDLTILQITVQHCV